MWTSGQRWRKGRHRPVLFYTAPWWKRHMVRSDGRCIAHALTANNERQGSRRSATGEGHAATRNTGARGISKRTGDHPAQSQIWTTGRRLRNTGFRDWTWRTAHLFRKAGTAHRSCRGNRARRALGYHPCHRTGRVSDCHSRGWGGGRRSDPLRRAPRLLADAMAISSLLTVAGASPHCVIP
jgi:hypothetical protein